MLCVKINDLQNLFPRKLHAVIFVAYMGLFINQGILVTATKNKENHYSYNPTTTVLLSEFLKLLVSSTLFIKDASVSDFIKGVKDNGKVMILYLVPSFLYCLYNNLTFINLGAYDPTSYYLLLQFRVVVTGVIFQFLFRKQLSGIQWFSLLLLTLGCIIKQLNFDKISSVSFNLNINLALILVQVFCSCFAGVYNEYLLKGKGGDVPFMLQNVFMYVDSMFCNIAVLGVTGHLQDALTAKSVSSILQVKVICIIVNNAAIGIVTALFLRSLNSILKTFASALELMFTALLSWIIFGIKVNLFTVIAIAIVSYATLLYAQNPVDNTTKQEAKKTGESVV
eukprot:gene20076-22046_t